MAPPPLLPLTRLILCTTCSEHVKLVDSHCPHCGAALAAPGGLGRAVLTAAAMAGVLSSCTAEPDYGVPTSSDTLVTETDPGTGTTADTGTTDVTADTGSTTGAPTTGEPTSTDTGEQTQTGTGDETATDTGEMTSTDTGSSEDTGAMTSSGEPDYGVSST